MKQLIAGLDKYSTPLWMRELPDTCIAINLAANTDATFLVPIGTRYAILTATDNFFVGPTAITLPTGVQASVDHELNVEGIWISNETELHVRGRNAMDVTISFWG